MSRGLASFRKYCRPNLYAPSSRKESRLARRHQQNLTVMFTDIAGFTGISETLGDAVVPVLADYLEAVSTAVLSHCGGSTSSLAIG